MCLKGRLWTCCCLTSLKWTLAPLWDNSLLLAELYFCSELRVWKQSFVFGSVEMLLSLSSLKAWLFEQTSIKKCVFYVHRPLISTWCWADVASPLINPVFLRLGSLLEMTHLKPAARFAKTSLKCGTWSGMGSQISLQEAGVTQYWSVGLFIWMRLN